MNAKEAKERALWLRLPIMLRSKIDAAIGRGELEVEYYYSDKISSDAINDIYGFEYGYFRRNHKEQGWFNEVNANEPNDFNIR